MGMDRGASGTRPLGARPLRSPGSFPPRTRSRASSPSSSQRLSCRGGGGCGASHARCVRCGESRQLYSRRETQPSLTSYLDSTSRPITVGNDQPGGAYQITVAQFAKRNPPRDGGRRDHAGGLVCCANRRANERVAIRDAVSCCECAFPYPLSIRCRKLHTAADGCHHAAEILEHAVQHRPELVRWTSSGHESPCLASW